MGRRPSVLARHGGSTEACQRSLLVAHSYGSPMEPPGFHTAGTNVDFIPDWSSFDPHVFPADPAWSGCLKREERSWLVT